MARVPKLQERTTGSYSNPTSLPNATVKSPIGGVGRAISSAVHDFDKIQKGKDRAELTLELGQGKGLINEKLTSLAVEIENEEHGDVDVATYMKEGMDNHLKQLEESKVFKQATSPRLKSLAQNLYNAQLNKVRTSENRKQNTRIKKGMSRSANQTAYAFSQIAGNLKEEKRVLSEGTLSLRLTLDALNVKPADRDGEIFKQQQDWLRGGITALSVAGKVTQAQDMLTRHGGMFGSEVAEMRDSIRKHYQASRKQKYDQNELEQKASEKYVKRAQDKASQNFAKRKIIIESNYENGFITRLGYDKNIAELAQDKLNAAEAGLIDTLKFQKE